MFGDVAEWFKSVYRFVRQFRLAAPSLRRSQPLQKIPTGRKTWRVSVATSALAHRNTSVRLKQKNTQRRWKKTKTKIQLRTHMKHRANFKQRLPRSFYVLAAADAHCAYRIRPPDSNDHYLSLAETLQPTLRRSRSVRFFPSFGLTQLIQHLSQLSTSRRLIYQLR